MPGCGSGAVVCSCSLLFGCHLGRRQAETPITPLSRFSQPALSSGNGLKSIKNFAGTKVALVVVPDVEAIRLARDIAQLLEEGKWIGTFAVEAPIPGSAIPDGVEIWLPANMRSGKRPDHSSPIFKAGYALSLVMLTEYIETGMSPNTAIENRFVAYPPNPNW